VLTLAYCGIRWAEATGLRVTDVDLEKCRFVISENAVDVGGVIEVGTPKNHKRRSVPFPLFLGELLTEACKGKKPDELVFPDKHGYRILRVRVSKDSRSWFKTALVTAGLPRMVLHPRHHGRGRWNRAGPLNPIPCHLPGHRQECLSRKDRPTPARL
jgi:integrase